MNEREKIPSPEFSPEEQQLIANLRERGIADAKTKEALLAWTEAREIEANAINAPRTNIELNVKQAKLYSAAGFTSEAWDILESVRTQASNEGEDDLYNEATGLMDGIDAASNHGSAEVAQQSETPESESGKKPEEFPADRIGREETEKLMPEMKRLVTRGLGDLFELLLRSSEANKGDVIGLIEHTELNLMLPGMRKKFADEMIRKKINKIKEKADFIGTSLETETIKMFIHLEAMKGSSEAVLTRLREEREAAQTQPKDGQAERDAKLAELRNEIMGSPDRGDGST